MARTLENLYEDLRRIAETRPPAILIGLWDFELILSAQRSLATGKPPTQDDLEGDKRLFRYGADLSFGPIPIVIDFQKPYAFPSPLFDEEKEGHA